MTGRQISALRILDPLAWEARVRDALALGRAGAAKRLGVSDRTLGRWLREMGVKGKRGGRREGAGRPRVDLDRSVG